MTLAEAAESACELTRELQEALAGEELALCEDLLMRRAEAMVLFEDRQRSADDEERAEARGLILELAERDRRLQEKAADVFALAEQAVQAPVGADAADPPAPVPAGTEN